MSRHATHDDVLEALEAHMVEQYYLMEQLALWRHVEKAGFNSDGIKTFSFRPKFLTRDEEKSLGRDPGCKAACYTHFNCVRLTNGVVAQIPLYPRPRKS